MSYPIFGRRRATARALTALFCVAAASGAVGFASAIAAPQPTRETDGAMVASFGGCASIGTRVPLL